MIVKSKLKAFSKEFQLSKAVETDLVKIYRSESITRQPLSSVRPKYKKRRSVGGPTALVFSGGGNKGAAQIGMLQALIEYGFRFDFLVGCSVGALNAAGFANNPTLQGVSDLKDLWLSLKTEDVFSSSSLFGGIRFAEKRRSVYSNSGLKHIINSMLAKVKFEDLKLPLYVGATSFNTGDEVWFDSGDLMYPLLASTALPGIFPPVSIDNMNLVDGGVLNDAPISKALELGATSIFLLSCNTVEINKPLPDRPIETIIESFGVAIAARLKRELNNLPEGIEVLVGEFAGPYNLNWKDFSHTDQLIRRSYEEMSRFLRKNYDSLTDENSN